MRKCSGCKGRKECNAGDQKTVRNVELGSNFLIIYRTSLWLLRNELCYKIRKTVLNFILVPGDPPKLTNPFSSLQYLWAWPKLIAIAFVVVTNLTTISVTVFNSISFKSKSVSRCPKFSTSITTIIFISIIPFWRGRWPLSAAVGHTTEPLSWMARAARK